MRADDVDQKIPERIGLGDRDAALRGEVEDRVGVPAPETTTRDRRR
jgi:hypothetical protein